MTSAPSAARIARARSSRTGRSASPSGTTRTVGASPGARVWKSLAVHSGTPSIDSTSIAPSRTTTVTRRTSPSRASGLTFAGWIASSRSGGWPTR